MASADLRLADTVTALKFRQRSYDKRSPYQHSQQNNGRSVPCMSTVGTHGRLPVSSLRDSGVGQDAGLGIAGGLGVEAGPRVAVGVGVQV